MFVFSPAFKPARKPGPEKKKKAGERVTKLGPDAPWATQAVTSKDGTLVRLEPVHKDRPNPWTVPGGIHLHPTDLAYLHPAHPTHKQEPRPAPEEAGRVEAGRSSPARVGSRLVSAQNYAATEAGAERYGLIDTGPCSQGRSLIVHVRKNLVAWRVLNPIRPGAILRVRPISEPGGKPTELRVRYTTPAGYFSPGKKVSTLAIGVDESDWRSLTGAAPRI